MYLFFTGRARPVFYATFSLVALLLGFYSQHVLAEAQSPLATTALQINQHTIQAEVANTESTRAKGLMFRQSLNPNSGMLFVFDHPMSACFWMKNTFLPLSIAFITTDGAIINIEAMQPLSTASVCPLSPVKYALEMEQGWFTEKNIYAGDTVERLPKK